MVTRQGEADLHSAEVHCSISNDELHIHPAKSPPAPDARHTRRSFDGVLLNCCSRTRPFKPKIISLYEVLSATFQSNVLRISCAHRDKKRQPVRTYCFEGFPEDQGNSFVDAIWKSAYRGVPCKRRALVLLNPYGGSGKAKSIWSNVVKHIFDGAQYHTEVRETAYSGHAMKIAAQLEIQKYDLIICVSGDGLPHEVINGLGSRQDALNALKTPIGFIPAGSGNGSAKSIYDTQKHIDCALAVIKGQITAVDLVSMTQGTRRFLSYFSLSFGVIADCDLGTEHLRWMGEARFTYGVLQRIISRTCYPCTLALSIVTDDKDLIRRQYHEHTTAKHSNRNEESEHSGDDSSVGLPELKYGTVNDPIPSTWTTKRFPKMGTFYVGLMPYMSSTTCFFPTAVPASGMLDVLHIQADLPFFAAVSTVSEVDTAKHFDSPHCFYAKCDAFRLIPDGVKGFISVDGEKVHFAPIQGEIHHALGRIITKNGSYFSEFSE